MEATDHTSNGHDASDAIHQPLEALKSLVPADALQAVTDLPERLRTELRERPYRTLAIAVGVGVGVGAMASSRVMRFLVMNLGGFALTEIARRGAKGYIERMIGAR